MSPVVRPTFTMTKINGKSILSAEIAECNVYSRLCFYKGKGRLGGSYVRVGDADMPMSEYEVYNYEAYKRNIRDELRVVEGSSLDDLDENKLNQYLYRISESKPNLASLDKKEKLTLGGFIVDDSLTLAGLLLFGKYPQKYYPMLSITAVLVDGYSYDDLNPNARFLDNKRFEGSLKDMLDGAFSFVMRNTRSVTYIDDNGQRDDIEEYPKSAIREVIVNALIHRDYSIYSLNSSIRITIYKDRIEIENPGCLFGTLSVEDLGTTMSANTRNPAIALASETLSLTENRFTGIPIIRKAMKEASLKAPVFINKRTSFLVTLYNEKDNEEDDDLIKFLKKPRTRKEIANYLSLESESYAINTYIKPLIDKGIVKLTIPTKPRSSRQKYYVV